MVDKKVICLTFTLQKLHKLGQNNRNIFKRSRSKVNSKKKNFVLIGLAKGESRSNWLASNW